MKLFDCHLHTDLSFDSREPMENYVKQAVAAGDDYFISTEHFDLESHIMDGGDIAADLDRQQQIIAQLNEKYPINVLISKGLVEVKNGYLKLTPYGLDHGNYVFEQFL